MDAQPGAETEAGAPGVYLGVCTLGRPLDDQTQMRIRLEVEALVRDLGPVEAMRFLSLRRTRVFDSVAHHRQWQESLDKDRFFNEVFERLSSSR